ncbi:hypothetical protein DPMN_114177 [Dreissena polymorpha]|uniref:Uncharacterized protein n=1 Tax=Dreissena polymorpha TaxID=45954 RepID=A0A9D4QRB5_DREPO|nr:hypothetical protein DPMN_114177 [Dreissena polymorpha]
MLRNASKCSSINIYDHDQRHRRPTTETHCPSGTFERNARLVQYFQPIHNEIVASMNIYDHDQRHRRPITETHTYEYLPARECDFDTLIISYAESDDDDTDDGDDDREEEEEMKEDEDADAAASTSTAAAAAAAADDDDDVRDVSNEEGNMDVKDDTANVVDSACRDKSNDTVRLPSPELNASYGGAPEWEMYKGDFIIHLDALGQHDAPGRRQVGVLLSNIGRDSVKINDNFTWSPRNEANEELGIVARDAEDRYDLDTVFGKFDRHFGLKRKAEQWQYGYHQEGFICDMILNGIGDCIQRNAWRFLPSNSL